MSKFYLDAYVNGNFGDDLLIYILCTRYPNHNFYMIIPYQYKNIFKDINNLHPLVWASPDKNRILLRIRKKVLELLRIFKRYSVYKECREFEYSIMCGGSMFIQNENWEKKIQEDKKIHILFSKNIIIGCNFGPYTVNAFYESYKKEFKKCQFISFRDNYSYKLFKDLPNVKKGCDIAFQLKDLEERMDKNYVVVSVINCGNRKNLCQHETEYRNFVKKLINVIPYNKQVILCSLCEAEGDLITCKNLYDILDSKNQNRVNIYSHNNIINTINLFKNASAIVGTRFHSIMLALKYDVPIIPIVYSDKTSNELQDLEYQGDLYDIRNLQKYSIEDIKKQLLSKPIYNKEAAKSSKNHFEYLDNM